MAAPCPAPGNYAMCLLFKPMCPSVPFPQTAATASAPHTWLGYDITKHTVLKKKKNKPTPRAKGKVRVYTGFGGRVGTGGSKFSEEAGRGACGGQLGVATTMSQTWLGWASLSMPYFRVSYSLSKTSSSNICKK